MALDLTEQISNFSKKKWVNLQGLVDCSTIHLFSTASCPSCSSISLLGRGSYNTVYGLVFDDGTEIAASISNDDDEDFDAQVKRPEIETMRFVRESGLYPDVPVPKVHAWDTTFDNPVGAPYVLMDVVQGETLLGFESEDGLRGLDALVHVQQLSVVKTLAKLKASLSKPVPFDKIGSVTIDALYQPLSALIPHFKIPQAYSQLVLHHPDLALRNIFLDKELLLSDHPKIAGVIDWSGSQILPLMLSALYPNDLTSIGDEPFSRPDHPDEGWRSVPSDWTSLGDGTKWPPAFRGPDDPVDYTPRVSAMVRRFYLRTYFSAYYAEQLDFLYGDTDLVRASLFADAPFHETVCGGWQSWVEHASWIQETYRR